MIIDISKTPPSQSEIDVELAALPGQLNKWQRLMLLAWVVTMSSLAVLSVCLFPINKDDALIVLAADGGFGAATAVGVTVAVLCAGIAVGFVADNQIKDIGLALDGLQPVDKEAYDEIAGWLEEPVILRYRNGVEAQRRDYFIRAEVEALKAHWAEHAAETTTEIAHQRVFPQHKELS